MIKNIKLIRELQEIEKSIDLEIAKLFDKSFGLTMDLDTPDNYLIRKAIYRLKEIEAQYNIEIIEVSLFAVVLILTDNFGYGQITDLEEVSIDIEKESVVLIDNMVEEIIKLLERKKELVKKNS